VLSLFTLSTKPYFVLEPPTVQVFEAASASHLSPRSLNRASSMYALKKLAGNQVAGESEGDPSGVAAGADSVFDTAFASHLSPRSLNRESAILFLKAPTSSAAGKAPTALARHPTSVVVREARLVTPTAGEPMTVPLRVVACAD
jgi:hypothetical protein